MLGAFQSVSYFSLTQLYAKPQIMNITPSLVLDIQRFCDRTLGTLPFEEQEKG